MPPRAKGNISKPFTGIALGKSNEGELRQVSSDFDSRPCRRKDVFRRISLITFHSTLLQSLHVHRCEISGDNKSELETEEKKLNKM